MSGYKKILLPSIIIIYACLFNQAFSQSSITSPYSHYGVGDLLSISNTRNRSMGSIGYAQRGYYNINPLNPASYTSYDSMSFVFEGGMRGSFVTLNTNELSENASSAGLDFLFFGFPVSKRLGVSFGTMPFSTVGYKILDKQIDPLLGEVDYYYQGDGGLNQYYIGVAFKLHKNFSIGVNAIYLAGDLERSRLLHFPDSATILNTRIRDNIHVSDISYSAGIQYHDILKKGNKINMGLTVSYGNKLKTNTDNLSETLFGGINGGYEYYKDTIEYISDIAGDLNLPLHIGGGILYEIPEKLCLGGDFTYSFWEDYTISGKTDSLKNSYRINAGLEWIPDNRPISKYWQKIRYRVGMSYNNTYLKLNGSSINEFTASVGLGLPLRRQASTINFGAEFGNRGTTNNALIKETNLRIFIGISITERWFVKRKYN